MKRGWDENIYAIWNPVPVYNGREIDKEFFTGGRTPLVIAVSKDNGQTFTEPVAFEEEPDRKNSWKKKYSEKKEGRVSSDIRLEL